MDCAFVALEGTGQINADLISSVVSMAVLGLTMSCFIESWKKIIPQVSLLLKSHPCNPVIQNL